MQLNQSHSRRRIAAVAAVLAVALFAAACGGGSSKGESSGSGSGDSAAGKPKSGGTVNYGLEAETESYCIPGRSWRSPASRSPGRSTTP